MGEMLEPPDVVAAEWQHRGARAAQVAPCAAILRLVASLPELVEQVGVCEERPADRHHVAVRVELAFGPRAPLEAAVGDDRKNDRLLEPLREMPIWGRTGFPNSIGQDENHSRRGK